MEGVRDDDPFHWDVATVISVLAAPNCPWTSNPSVLAVQIREEEIDGATLLKFEDVCNRQELMECLGLRLARHKVAFGEALFTLKSKSRAYQQWKQDFTKKQVGCFEFDDTKKSPSLSITPFGGAPVPHIAETASRPPSQPASDLHRTSSAPEAINSPVHSIQDASDSLQSGVIPNENNPSTEPTPRAITKLPTPPQISDAADENTETRESDNERPVKRKRLAPVTVTTRPRNIAPAFIPTEADTISAAYELQPNGLSELPWEEAPLSAYLGNGSLPLEMIKSSSKPLSSRVVELPAGSFGTTVPNWLPPGRRLVVHRGMKKLLRKNSYREMQEKQGYAVLRSPSPGDTDSVLDLVDLPDAFDEETLREIEEERQERERYEALVAELSLSAEKVRDILNDAIEAMSAAWQEKKLPKHLKKAYGLWRDARRKGTKKQQVLDAHRQAKFYDDRVKKLCAEIMGETWTKESDLRNQSNCLEQSIQDKLYNGWLAEMLESRVEPPKPQTIPRPKSAPSKKPDNFLDEEILTSSDEEEFIVPDDIPEPPYQEPLTEVAEDLPDAVLNSSLPVKDESPEFLDLTEAAWGPSSSIGPKTQAFIDLTSINHPTPDPMETTSQTSSRRKNDTLAKTPPPDTLPSPEDFENFEEIGAKGPNCWYKSRDRWRLLITLMWQLPHSRRAALLEFIQARSPEDAWEESIQAHLSDPIKSIQHLGQSDKTVAFDVTRIFLCVVRVKHYVENDQLLLSFTANWKRKFANPDNRRWFFLIWSFIKDVAHRFPQESQIYRPDVSDDDLEEDLDEELILDEKQTQPKPQRAAKEIIQDKDGVDLRERERMRVEEQQVRRDKLRKNLALLGTMPRDRARLIVNESKQDEEQPLIYINEEIGNRIKDHQLEGVRFMWNQIVLDSDTRQGCLLAHTMGLGKTMQVITLLVVIQEAAQSADPGVKAQVPEDLRDSRTIVVCPATLVDNWVDELLMWAPDGILGEFRRIDSKTRTVDRPETIQQWAKEGGVLVIGYPMLSRVLSDSPEIEDLVLNTANIVVADEAHYMKNQQSLANRSCSRFRTKSRIALTGSPLANNVEEYRAMIDWVAPNFLGPLAEFRQIYANPIQHGLWRNSSGAEKRLALKKLEALKVTVAPKVHRATIKTCLKDDLPSKYEFVIFVPPTPLQSRLYAIYLDAVGQDQKLAKSRILGISNDLGLICNHPRCFHQKIKAINEGVPHLDEEGDESDASTFPKSIIPQALKELKAPDPNLASLSWKVELLTIILNEAREVGDKVLVFTQSLLTLSYLKNLFQMQKRRVTCLMGDTAMNTRQEITKDFNTGDKEVYLISTKAGGVGLNIHGANRVVIFDFKWNPVSEQQAIGRAYRIGQKKTVYVYTLVVAGTFEEDIQNKHVFKTQLASRVVDKKNPVSWSNRTAMILHPIRNAQGKDLVQFTGKDSILDKLIAYKKDSESIRSIISTDTFEEEDEDVNLTEIERREIASMVELERLRNKDPAAYQRAKTMAEQEEYHRLPNMSRAVNEAPQPSSSGIRLRLNPSGYQNSVNHSMDGSCDVPDMVAERQALIHSRPANFGPHTPTSVPMANSSVLYHNYQNQPQVPSMGIAPLPVAGANTYFGKPPSPLPPTTIATAQARAPVAYPTPAPVPSSAPAPPSSPFRGNLFSLPVSQFKMNFQNHLESRIQFLQHQGLIGTAWVAGDTARRLTASITAKRDEKRLGFVLDDQHWKLLESLLVHDRFVISLISGNWGVEWVAFANRKELESRIEVANGLPETEISAQANRKAYAPPDPQNLQNIERSMRQEGGPRRNRHAADDMEVMKEAAWKRKERDAKLPSWASQALVEEQQRAFPASGTIESVRDRRGGFIRGSFSRRGRGGRGA